MVAAALGLVLAIVMGMLAMSQVDSLNDLSTSITTGSLRRVFDTTNLMLLLVVVVTAVGGVVGALMLISRR
jgi:pheromone shutdown protein TraB